jgi:hypothetical protein
MATTLTAMDEHIGAPDAALRRRLDALAVRLEQQRIAGPPQSEPPAPEVCAERAEELASLLFADRDERYPHTS